MPYQCEYTDTFSGEANYSWVRRATIADLSERPTRVPNPSRTPSEKQRVIMRRAKAALGLSGTLGETTNYGDGYEFRPRGMATVLFVTWTEEGDDA